MCEIPVEEAQLYKRSHQPLTSSECIVLPSFWYKSWESYVLGESGSPPSPMINTTKLVESGSCESGQQHIRNDITHSDVRAISPQVWTRLTEIYPNSGPELRRPVARKRKNDDPEVLLHPMVIRVCQRGARNPQFLFDIGSEERRPLTATTSLR